MDPLVGSPKQTTFSMVADDGQSTTIAYDEPSNTSASVANSIFGSLRYICTYPPPLTLFALRANAAVLSGIKVVGLSGSTR